MRFNIKDLHPAFQLIFLVVLALAGSLSVIAVSMIIAVPIWGKVALEYSLENPEVPLSLHRYMQTVSQIGLFLVPSLLFVKILYSDITKHLKLPFSIHSWKPAFWAVLSFVCIIPFLDCLTEWNQTLHFPELLQEKEQLWREKEEMVNQLMTIFTNDASISGLFANLFVVALIPTLCEEIFFRGVLQQFFKNVFHGKAHPAILITAIIFTLFHNQMFSFLPRLVLGLLLGYLFEYGKTLVIPFFAHFVNNALIVILYFLYKNGNIAFDPEKLVLPGNPVFWIVLSIFLFTVTFYMFIRTSKSRNQQRK